MLRKFIKEEILLEIGAGIVFSDLKMEYAIDGC